MPATPFDQNVAFDTGTITLRHNNGGWADLEVFNVSSNVDTGSGGVSISGASLTINPTSELVNSREYAIRISADAIEGYNGNLSFAGIANDTGWSFTAQPSSGIAEPDAIYDTGEIFAWWDGRTGVAHTSKAVDSWTDQSGNAYVADDRFAAPTWQDTGYIQFGDGVDDGLKGSTSINLSSHGTATIYLRARMDAPHSFILATDSGNNAPHIIIAEAGSASTGIGIGTTVYKNGVQETTRGGLWGDTGDWHTYKIVSADISGLTHLDIAGYVSSTFNAPISIAQILFVDTGPTGDTGQKQADVETFMDSLTYT